MIGRMIRQSFSEGRRRKMLAALTVALAAALITTLFTLSVDVGDKMSAEMKAYGSNIRVLPKSESIALRIGGVDYNPLKGRDYLDESELPYIKDIFWSNNIVGYAPLLEAPVRAAGQTRDAALIGTYFDKNVPLDSDEDYRTGVTVTHPFWELVDGSWPDDEAGDELLVGRTLAGTAGLQPGDTVTLALAAESEGGTGSASYRVTGILSTGEAEDDAFVAPLAAVQALTGLEGKVQSVSVSALTIPENELSRKAIRDMDSLSTAEYDSWYCSAFVSSIAFQIEEAVVNSAARPVWQVAEGEGAVISKLQVLMLVVTLAAFVSAAMGVSSLMSISVMERAGEIGLMKALGAERWEINLLFLGEAAIIGLLGGLAGVVAGTLLSQLVGLAVFGSTLAFHWIAVPVVVAVSVLTALAGAILPARTISQLMPVEVLYGR
ncbi:putative ABC transport system permease protein [Paracoccus halophilus]|uniref:ABC transporter permease n=1 Tax=Paracoccus halophilus TaxID=376733 RepID=A0A099F8V0_9RHOB|nr:FtsX-like permease family protein [Paracoccus halophilus]KGJ06658.1 ABC transporter permease [Paracoccus halophilus]SFA42387.1 putative ABC transport system permease protein [Paracoccus halophilus]